MAFNFYTVAKIKLFFHSFNTENQTHDIIMTYFHGEREASHFNSPNQSIIDTWHSNDVCVSS